MIKSPFYTSASNGPDSRFSGDFVPLIVSSTRRVPLPKRQPVFYAGPLDLKALIFHRLLVSTDRM
jgi:hypothetical protein